MTIQPVAPLPLEVAVLRHTLNRARRMLDESRELFRTVALDVAHQAEVVERLEAELKEAREVAS